MLRMRMLFATLLMFSACAWAQDGGASTTSSGQASTPASGGQTPAPTTAGQSPATPPAAAAAAPPAPMTTPSMTGPLQMQAPITFDAGPLGKLNVNGIISGLGYTQGSAAPGDATARTNLSNGQVFIQKVDGVWQFYLQAGAYTIPALGTPYLSNATTLRGLYGPVPEGYLKVQPTKTLSILIGELPTLIGAEYTFTFENMNIERGLLWNQENVINRGIQVNDTFGKLTASLSYNDGYYSDRYTWLTGSLAYAFNAANTLSFVAGGNLGQTHFATLSTPVQNNGSLYNLIYTYTKGNWTVTPYYQYTSVPTNQQIGIVHGSSTQGGALLVNYSLPHHFALSGRAEYLTSSGSAAQGAVNLLYGPGSGAWSITVTPTFQDHGFFARGDFSFVGATSYTPGFGFGRNGTSQNQPRGVLEVGFMF